MSTALMPSLVDAVLMLGTIVLGLAYSVAVRIGAMAALKSYEEYRHRIGQ